jgi:hypothetical protein
MYTLYHQSDQNKEDDMGMSCSTHGIDDKCDFGHLNGDERIILK